MKGYLTATDALKIAKDQAYQAELDTMDIVLRTIDRASVQIAMNQDITSEDVRTGAISALDGLDQLFKELRSKIVERGP